MGLNPNSLTYKSYSLLCFFPCHPPPCSQIRSIIIIIAYIQARGLWEDRHEYASSKEDVFPTRVKAFLLSLCSWCTFLARPALSSPLLPKPPSPKTVARVGSWFYVNLSVSNLHLSGRSAHLLCGLKCSLTSEPMGPSKLCQCRQETQL